jgi:RNA polymerase sigma-70 factor (sigma-E family)
MTETGRPPGGTGLESVHREEYAPLVRMAALVLGDAGLAEQVVQDAFVRLYVRRGGLRRIERPGAYLRNAVLNGCRSQLRHRRVVDRHEARHTVLLTSAATPESEALAAAEHERVVRALRSVSARQREALVLRYYLDLSEAEIAAAMGVSAGSVKTHLHRGLAALAQLLGEDDR